MTPALRRAAMIAALVAVLAGTGVVDRLVARSTPPGSPVGSLSAVAVAPARGTESSAWYCAGVTGTQGGAPGTIVLTNGSARTVRGTVTVVPAETSGTTPSGPWAGATSFALDVPADAETVVPTAQLGSANWLAAAVVLDGGGVAVSEAASGSTGWSMAPCAASSSTTWYFAHGATAQGGGLALSLFNPGATDATVDVDLVSAGSGFLEPAAYQGIDVPPGGAVTENLGDHDATDADLATQVTTLSGSVVAAELEEDGTAGNGGLSLTLGCPTPVTRWVFPQSTDLPGGTVSFHVFNPSGATADVSVAVELPEGAAAEPLSMQVAPRSAATLVAQSQTRIPTGVPYAAVFTSKGAAVVVTRQVADPVASPPSAPEDGDVTGVPGGSTTWLVPTVVAPGTGASSLAVVDLGSSPTTVRVVAPDGRPVAGQPPHALRPGIPLVLVPGPHSTFGTGPFEVVAGQPVAVELDAVPAAGAGVVAVPALARP